MAKSGPGDCICRSKTGGETTISSVAFDLIEYNPRCPWHKGPDKGYGYDENGRPNDKYAERVGTIGATIVIGGSAIIIAVLIGLAFIKW